eukprot:2967674-Rhodomonas_salina.1
MGAAFAEVERIVASRELIEDEEMQGARARSLSLALVLAPSLLLSCSPSLALALLLSLSPSCCLCSLFLPTVSPSPSSSLSLCSLALPLSPGHVLCDVWADSAARAWQTRMRIKSEGVAAMGIPRSPGP